MYAEGASAEETGWLEVICSTDMNGELKVEEDTTADNVRDDEGVSDGDVDTDEDVDDDRNSEDDGDGDSEGD